MAAGDGRLFTMSATVECWRRAEKECVRTVVLVLVARVKPRLVGWRRADVLLLWGGHGRGKMRVARRNGNVAITWPGQAGVFEVESTGMYPVVVGTTSAQTPAWMVSEAGGRPERVLVVGVWRWLGRPMLLLPRPTPAQPNINTSAPKVHTRSLHHAAISPRVLIPIVLARRTTAATLSSNVYHHRALAELRLPAPQAEHKVAHLLRCARPQARPNSQ